MPLWGSPTPCSNHSKALKMLHSLWTWLPYLTISTSFQTSPGCTEAGGNIDSLESTPASSEAGVLGGSRGPQIWALNPKQDPRAQTSGSLIRWPFPLQAISSLPSELVRQFFTFLLTFRSPHRKSVCASELRERRGGCIKNGFVGSQC